MIVALFILNLVILALLILHSYIYRGVRFTTNFFILGFLWTFRKGGGVTRMLHRICNEFPPPGLDFIVSLMSTILWLTIFYIGLALAEKIIKRVKNFEESLFTTLLLSSLIIASISYCIEIIFMQVGWWYWVSEYTLSGFLNNNSGFILEAWFFFSGNFLLAFTVFLLIECSKYKRTNWKYLLVTLPFIQEWSFQYLGPSRPRFFIIEERFVFVVLLALSLFCLLRFEYCYGGELHDRLLKSNSKVLYLLSSIPLFAMLLISLIVFVIDIFVLKQPLILISTIPAIFFILFYFHKIPIWFVMILSLPFLLLWQQRFILNIIPVAFILTLHFFSFIKREKSLIQ